MRLTFGVRLSLFALLGALVSACGGVTQQNSALPSVSNNKPSNGGPVTNNPITNNLAVNITEFPMPAGQSVGVDPIIGPDGAVWLDLFRAPSASPIQIDRVLGNGSITTFTIPASLLTALGGSEWAGEPLVSYQGRILQGFDEAGGPGIGGIFESGFVQLTTAGSSINAALFETNNFIGPMAVQNGKLYLFLNNIQSGVALTALARSGNNLVFAGPQDVSLLGMGGFGLTIAAGTDGNLYALAALQAPVESDFVLKLSPTGTVLATFALPLFAHFPYTIQTKAMSFGPDGALWIAEESAGVIGHLTTSGAYTQFTVPFSGSSPMSIAQGNDGAMWFTDPGTNAIGRITSTGSITEFPVPTANAGVGGIVSCPVGCVSCAAGSLWFTEINADKIVKLEF